MVRSRRREQLKVLVAAWILAATPSVRAAPAETVETSIQAAYLYQFMRFVEWPSADAAAPLAVCVVGRDPFGKVLDSAVEDRRVAGRRVTVVRLPDAAKAEGCDLVFLPAGESARLPELLRTVGRGPVLVVGDAPRFAQSGGMIGFYRDADRVRFEVNPKAAEAAGLRISSRLLALARIVGGTEASGR